MIVSVAAGCGSVSNGVPDAAPRDACTTCDVDALIDAPADAAIDAATSTGFSLEFDGTTLPSGLGWTFGSDCGNNGGVDLAEAEAFAINAGFLHLDTTGPSTSIVDSYYTLNDAIDSRRDWAIEARLRVTALESAPPTARQAITFNLFAAGEFFPMQIADAVLTDDDESAAVDTTQFHVYRMSRAAGASTYTVEVDGTPVLTHTPFAASVELNQITFGDGTCSARNGVVDVDYVRFTQPL